MRIFLIVTLCNVFPFILATELEFINYDLADFHIHAKVGTLPQKYTPLTEQDQHASGKAIDFVDFIHLVPNIDPLKRTTLEPLGINLPSLWLTGKVFMNNFILAGIKQIDVRNIELRLKNFRTDLNISLPLLYVEGEFNLQASISFLPVSLRCLVSANLMDVDVSLSSGSITRQVPMVDELTNTPKLDEIMQITSTDVKIDIRNVQLNITDVVIGGEHENADVTITQLFSRSATDFESAELSGSFYDGLLVNVLQKANEVLSKVSTDVFKSYLLSP